MAHLNRWTRYLKENLVANPTVAEVLSSAVIENHAREAGHRWRRSFWSPSMTITAFLLQVLSAEKTLRAGVALLLTQLAVRGEKALPSCDASAYCQARMRLPEGVLMKMVRRMRDHMQSFVTDGNGWLGHRVWVIDGSNVSMPDTPELQATYPQPEGQRPGCGFPIARVVAMFCWTTGAIVDLTIDAMSCGELTLFRRRLHLFQSNDVVLADRLYGSYVDIARLRKRCVYSVFRLHQRRKADYRKGKRLGDDDRLQTWTRPMKWIASCGISEEAFECLPETLTVRLVRIRHAPKGFRSRTVVVVTTLLDPIETPADELRALYRDRWTAELNLRSLKTHQDMEILRGHSPNVIRKEIMMHVLAYNLVRLLMWQTACEHGKPLHRLSFTGTLHRLRIMLPMLLLLLHRREQLKAFLSVCIAADVVPHRPNRLEPRRRKRRPKNYSLLTKPRRHYRRHGDPDAR